MSNEKVGCTIGPCTTVFIVFLVLKLVGVISWSWWWVTAPLWGPFAIAAAVIVVVLIVAVILQIIAGLFD